MTIITNNRVTALSNIRQALQMALELTPDDIDKDRISLDETADHFELIAIIHKIYPERKSKVVSLTDIAVRYYDDIDTRQIKLLLTLALSSCDDDIESAGIPF